MIVNRNTLLELAPIKDMLDHKVQGDLVSHGLSEAGYDIRLAQEITFKRNPYAPSKIDCFVGNNHHSCTRFTIASAMEEFQMPPNLVGIVHDKSTWARQGLSVFNTVIEPGFKGGLTLELAYHGTEELHIPAGAGIAQVVFHKTTDEVAYTGKYQNQSTDPEPARFS